MNATTTRASTATACAARTPPASTAADGPRRTARIARYPVNSPAATAHLHPTVNSHGPALRQRLHDTAALPVDNAPPPRTPHPTSSLLKILLSALSALPRVTVAIKGLWPELSPRRLAILALALLGAVAMTLRLANTLQTRTASEPASSEPLLAALTSPAPAASATASTAALSRADITPPQVNTPASAVIDVASDDALMSAAVARARQSLETFWQHAGAPGIGENDFALKVALPTRTGSLEHIWSTVDTRSGEQIVVRLSNEPVDVEGLGLGSAVTVTSAQISDWMFRRNGKIVGAETLRALIDTLPAPQGAQYRAMLETR